MKRYLSTLLLGLTLPLTVLADNTGLIEDQYIVSLDPLLVEDLGQVTTDLLSTLPGSELLHEYDTVLFGFAARMDAAQAEALRLLPSVRYVEQDQLFQTVGTQNNATWGLDRVDQQALPLDQTFQYVDGAGRGVHVYVVDTGINPDHEEFAGRVGESINFAAPGVLVGSADPEEWQDCQGHGTHVASTAVGTQWGVAKSATVHAVRVLNCFGNGSGSDIVAGMEWVAENAKKPAVANMSLGSLNGRSQAQEEAARNMYNAGVLPVVAAGNDGADACNTSPAAEPLALTIGATDNTDAQADFSNHGACVDMFGPGASITAADYRSNTDSTVKSGTSMATPHVAGAAAVLLSLDPTLTVAELGQALLDTATPGVLNDLSANTPNLMLYVSSDGEVPAPVDLPPQAQFSFVCDGLTCDFDASGSSDNEGIVSYEWDFGDGNFATGAQTSYTFAADGDYQVTVTVTDTGAQTASDTQTVTVEAPQSCGLFGCSSGGGGIFGF